MKQYSNYDLIAVSILFFLAGIVIGIEIIKIL